MRVWDRLRLYGFARARSTGGFKLQATPAMEAGVSDHVWSLDEITRAPLKSAISHQNVKTAAKTTTKAQTETPMTKFLSSIESWKSFFEWSSVVLLALTFVAGAGVVITSHIVNRKQEETILDLQRTTSDAKASQQRVEIDLGKTQKEVAEAKTKQADAEKELLALRHRRTQQKLPRWARLEPLAQYVKGKPAGSVEIVFAPDDDEAARTAMTLALMLGAEGKWKILRDPPRPISPDEPSLILPQYATPEMTKNPFHMPFITRMGILSDITVIASPDDLHDGFPKDGTAVHALLKGLHSCGFETGTNNDSRLPSGTARVVVGPKE